MKKLVAIIISSFIISASFAKGGSGEYFISGLAYLNHEILRESMLTVEFNNKSWNVTTDMYGNFEIKIQWVTACPSGLTDIERKRANAELNPKWITIKYQIHTMKVENLWETYAQMFYEDKSLVTRKFNLMF